MTEGRTVEEVKGELSEIDIAKIRKERKKQEGMAKTLADLIQLGKERGYKDSWAKIRYKMRMKRQVVDKW